MTPFRKTQLRQVLVGNLRSLAPHAASVDALREVVELLAYDRALWLELELLASNAKRFIRAVPPLNPTATPGEDR